MKKLIKLLNEWLKYKEKFGPDKLTRVTGIDDSGELLFKLENGCYWKVEYVISKRCEFIKWLVENNKIDFTKDNIEEFGYYGTEWHCDKYDNILMNLAIQDNPIEFLVSILKYNEIRI